MSLEKSNCETSSTMPSNDGVAAAGNQTLRRLMASAHPEIRMNQLDPHAHLRVAFVAGCRIQAWHFNHCAASWKKVAELEGFRDA